MAGRRWKDILWAVQPPEPGILGWTDWTTGVQFVAMDLEDPAQWPAVLQDGSERSRQVMHAVSHETLHFLQLATTGYLYRWACEQYRLTVAVLKPLQDRVADWLDDPDPRKLLAIGDGADPAAREALARHHALLDRRGPNRVSVRGLLEAHALVAEQKIHWEGLDAPRLLRLLAAESAGPTYRLAYDLLRARLGEALAYRNFLLVAGLALCAADPPLAFDELVDALARRPPPAPADGDDDAPDTAWVLAAAREAVGGMLGSSGELASADDAARHPVYTSALMAINRACDQGWRVVDFLADPRAGLATIAGDAMRPTVLRPTRDDRFPVIVPRQMSDAQAQDLLLVAVLTTRLVPPGPADPSADEAGDAPWAWLAELRGQLHALEVKAPQLASGELAGLTTLDPQGQSAEVQRMLCGLWGRCALMFELDDPGPAWQNPAVRRFIRRLAAAQPAFPAYLDPAPELGQFMLWFGALAEPAALDGLQLDLTHDSVLQAVLGAAAAVDAQAGQLGLSAVPVIQRLLHPYGRAQVQALLAALH